MSIANSERNKSNNDSNTTREEGPPKLPFVTTSDVLNKLNENLASLEDHSDGLSQSKPHVELHRRLPDGSTIPASQADLEYSDCQTKLQQSAAFVALLEPEERPKWAEQQRQTGNSYFLRGDYKTAMDVYLTCLVVKDSSIDFLCQTMVPVLSNLAQCTLQLGMHKKTMEFCTIALNEIETKQTQQLVQPLALSKIYFKRGKARRLTGAYAAARDDLNSSLKYCLMQQPAPNEDNQSVSPNTTSTIGPYQQAIQKEFRQLESAEKQARKNRQRQKRALQKALNKNDTTGTASSAVQSDASANGGAPRQYSKLRKKPKATPYPPSQEKEERLQLSYMQYYWVVVARVTETLLVWLGDEETKERLLQQERDEKRDWRPYTKVE